MLADSLQAAARAGSAARTSPSLKNKDLFLALDMPAAQNNKVLNERSSATLHSQASAYFCPQTSSVSLRLFILPARDFRATTISSECATYRIFHVRAQSAPPSPPHPVPFHLCASDWWNFKWSLKCLVADIEHRRHILAPRHISISLAWHHCDILPVLLILFKSRSSSTMCEES